MSRLFDVQANHVVTLRLPYPPTINSYYGRTRTGGRYIMPKGRDFRKKVIEILRPALHSKKTIEGLRLQMWVELFPPDRRKRDVDNILKALLDALTHAGVYEDDSFIDDLRVVRGAVIKGGYCRVVLSQIEVKQNAENT